MRLSSSFHNLCHIANVLAISKSQLRMGRLPDLAFNVIVAGSDFDCVQMYVSQRSANVAYTDSYRCPSERHWVSCLRSSQADRCRKDHRAEMELRGADVLPSIDVHHQSQYHYVPVPDERLS